MHLANEIQRATYFVIYTFSRVCMSTSPCCFQRPQIGTGEFLGYIQRYAMCSRKSLQQGCQALAGDSSYDELKVKR